MQWHETSSRVIPDPSAPAQQYTYDSNTGALSQITDLRGQVFGFSYTDAGQLQQLTYPGNVAEQILSFDADGSPLVRHVTRSGVPWIADTMVYDPVGRPLSVRGRNLTSGVPQVTYNAYDGLGSLAMTEFFNGGTPRLEQYWADALGTNYKTARHNIKLAQSEQNPIVKFPRYTGDGRIARDSMYTTNHSTEHDNTDYFYDAQGRTRYTYSRTYDYPTSTNDYHQSASYYDGNGRLAQFERHVGDMQQASLGQDPRAVVETYRYDALGRRILTHALRASNCTVAGCESTVQRFIWDGNQMLYEVRVRGDSAYFGYLDDDQGSGTGAFYAPNAYGRVGYTHAGGIDRPIGAVRGTTPFYPHTNWRGLYESATVDNGTVLTNDVNYPGASASAYLGWTPRSTPYEWFGSLVTEQADASGLLYRRNRYYDPKAGRFTQPDPIGIAGGLNSYGYAGGDPVNHSDPFGLFPIGPIISGAASAAARACATPAGSRVCGAVGGAVASRVGPVIQRGMNHPAVRSAVQRGQATHREFAQGMRDAGHQAEVVLSNAAGRVLGRLDGLVVDAQNKVLTIIELKPDNQRALQRGAAQVSQYADDVAGLVKDKVGQWGNYAGYAIKTEVKPYP